MKPDPLALMVAVGALAIAGAILIGNHNRATNAPTVAQQICASVEGG